MAHAATRDMLSTNKSDHVFAECKGTGVGGMTFGGSGLGGGVGGGGGGGCGPTICQDRSTHPEDENCVQCLPRAKISGAEQSDSGGSSTPDGDKPIEQAVHSDEQHTPAALRGRPVVHHAGGAGGGVNGDGGATGNGDGGPGGSGGGGGDGLMDGGGGAGRLEIQ